MKGEGKGWHGVGPDGLGRVLSVSATRRGFLTGRSAGAEYYEKQYQDRALRPAKRRAAQLGYQLVLLPDAPASGLHHGSEAAAA